MSISRFSLCVLAVTASACGGSGSTPKTQPAPVADGAILTPSSSEPAVNRNRDLITEQELMAPQIVGLTVLEAVKNLRPQYLTERGKNTAPAKAGNDPNGAQLTDDEAGKVHVSIDGNRVVSVGELSNIRANTIKEIRFLNMAQAHQKFGTAAREGPVILVTTM